MLSYKDEQELISIPWALSVPDAQDKCNLIALHPIQQIMKID